jgi:hypothetical protein
MLKPKDETARQALPAGMWGGADPFAACRNIRIVLVPGGKGTGPKSKRQLPGRLSMYPSTNG